MKNLTKRIKTLPAAKFSRSSVAAVLIFGLAFIFVINFSGDKCAYAQLPALSADTIAKAMFSSKVDERLCTEPPSRIEDFKLGPQSALLVPVVTATKFKYGEIQVIIRLFFGAVAQAIGYTIKKEDEPHIYEAGKKMIASEIDEALSMKYTWNGENQIFETIDSFFAARSERYSKKSTIDRRKLFNIVSEGPIYKTGTPVSLTPAAAAQGNSVTPLGSAFPPGHPYAGYTIYMSGPRGVWYFRDAVRRNITAINAALQNEDAELNAGKGGKVSPDKVVAKAADIKTLSEMMKLLRLNGAAEAKLADDKYFEASDISNDNSFDSLTQNSGDIVNSLKMSGYSVPAENIELYKKLWTIYSTPENK